jgi:ferredoxin
MARLDGVDEAALRRALASVRGKESTQQLMMAIAHKRGVGVRELADRYGLSVAVVEDWFDRLESAPLSEAVAGFERFSRSRSAATPTARDEDAVVEFLAYEAVDGRDWALGDDDLFERARAADRPSEVHGTVTVAPGESVLEAAEDADYAWPFACRGGACSNCAVYLHEGALSTPGDTILPPEVARDGSFRLACVATPASERVAAVTGVGHLPALSEYRLPATGFDIAESPGPD